MNRRAFLAGASGLAASGFSGCAGFGFGNGGNGYHLRLLEVPNDDLRTAVALTSEEQSSDQRALVTGAVESEFQTYGYRPLEDGAVVEHEGSYYRLQVEETGEKTHERTTLRGEVVDSAEAKEQAVDRSRFPEVDAKALKYAIATAGEYEETTTREETTSEQKSTTGERTTAGGEKTTSEEKVSESKSKEPHERGLYVFHDTDPEESALLPEPEYEYVEYQDQIIHLLVEQHRVTETEYTYTAEQVADSNSSFRKFAREEFVVATFERAALSEKQREILRKAQTEDDYSEFGDLSEDYRAILERIGGGEMPEQFSSEGYVSYESQFYEVRFTMSMV